MRSPPAALTASAMPKSATSACPSCSRMFSGLMSRWTTPCSMRVVERARDFARDPYGVVDGELRLALEPRAQRFARDERHDVEEQPVGFARVEQRQDVRMLQLRRRLDLGEESLGAEGRGELGMQDLDRDVAIVPEVAREIDRRHSADSDLAVDTVSALEGGGQARDDVAHGRKR